MKDFARLYFEVLAQRIESKFMRPVPAKFVERMIAFRDRTANLVPTVEPSSAKRFGNIWVECQETRSQHIPGPGRRRTSSSFQLEAATEFRLKRLDAGRKIAAHAFKLFGFSAREIHDAERREARVESRRKKKWVRRLQAAQAADDLLEENAAMAAGRHPAFRKFGRRAK